MTHGCKSMVFYNKLSNYYQRFCWFKKYNIKKNIQQIEELYRDCDGFALARAAKQLLPDLSLTYGEIQLESFLALLSMAKPQPSQKFYELGSGTGKTVFAAEQTYRFKQCVGVETLLALHAVAVNKLQDNNANITFLHADTLNINLQDADIIFINVASFVAEYWQLLTKKLVESSAKTILTCSKPMPENIFTIKKTYVQCSWGVVPAFINTR